VPTTAVLLAHCGGGGSTKNDNTVDSGGTSDVTVDMQSPPEETGTGDGGCSTCTAESGAEAGAISVVAPNVTVYVSQVANLNASATGAPADSGSVMYSWVVTTAPSGSTVNTASLQNPATATPSFSPDIVGTYTLTVTVTSGGLTATQTVTVQAVNAFVFYSTTKEDNVAPYFEFDVVQMDGTNPHAIACRSHTIQTLANPLTGQEAGVTSFEGGAADSGVGAQFLALTFMTADYSLDSWEGEAGTPGRGAFAQVVYTDAGASSWISYLLAATSDSTCQNPPTQVHAINGSDPQVLQPRISPDGTRIAYIEQRDQGNLHIATVGFDGTAYHDFGNMCVDAGSCGPDNFSLAPARPQWIDATHVAWMTESGGGNFTIVSAADIPSPQVTPYMACQGSIAPRGFAILKDGSVLANYSGVGKTVEDLVVFTVDTTGTCVLKKNLTKLPNAYSYARDFSVSPDGTMVAFVLNATKPGERDSGVGERFGGSLYVVPIDGSSAPTPVSGKDLFAYFGPRWIAGGTRLAWNGALGADAGTFDIADAGVTPDGGVPAMNVIALDGGSFTHAVASDQANELYVLGGGNGGGCSFQLCSTTQGKIPVGTGGIALGGLFSLVLFGRRRGRKSSS
jgi:hypothetical protein